MDKPSGVAEPVTQQLEVLKQKYQVVLNKIQQSGAKLQNVHMEGGKLLIRAEAASDMMKNQIWDVIKLADPNWSMDLVADITVMPAGLTPAMRTYTVKAGDTLSKISKEFYGDAKQYMKIFEANKDKIKDPDKIKPGQVLDIPS